MLYVLSSTIQYHNSTGIVKDKSDCTGWMVCFVNMNVKLSLLFISGENSLHRPLCSSSENYRD